jgi:hypothetical protein
MNILLYQRITAIMALLFLLTIGSWLLGHANSGVNVRAATILIILVAAFKIRYVMLDFMEIRSAPRLLRMFCEGWIAVLAVVILTLQWLGTR